MTVVAHVLSTLRPGFFDDSFWLGRFVGWMGELLGLCTKNPQDSLSGAGLALQSAQNLKTIPVLEPLLNVNHHATNQSTIKLIQLPEEKNVSFSKF